MKKRVKIREKKKNYLLFVVLFATINFLFLFPETVLGADAGYRSDALNWVYKQEGKNLDYDGAYGAQCVDLIKYYYEFFGQANYAMGNGCDYVSNALPEGWIRIKNTVEFVPEPGDIAVWGTSLSKNGHVAIILSANNSSFVSMDQNWPSGSSCKQVTHTYNNFWGVIRPNFKNETNLPDPNVENKRYDGATDHSDFRPVIVISNPETVSEVNFAVWYEGGTTKWYSGIYNGSNSWYCDVVASDLGQGKEIICHCYVRGKNGSYKGYVFEKKVLDKDQTDPNVENMRYDGATDHSDFRPVITISNPETVSKVDFAVWYEGGTTKWYSGIYNGDKSWYCDVASKDLGQGTVILCHCYVGGKNGSNKGYVFENKILDKDRPDPNVENMRYDGATDHSDFRPVITISNPETVSKVKFALCYDGNNWKWYDGKYNSNKSWYYDVVANNLGSGKTILCHCYVYGKNGSEKRYIFENKILDKDRPDPNVENMRYDGATDHSDFRPVITISNPETVSKVKFALCYDGNNWKWYDGKYNSNTSWYCDVATNSLGSGKTILCHCYVYGKNGSEKKIQFPNVDMRKNITDTDITFAGSMEYDGNAKKPVVTIKNGTTVLEEGVDYTVTYSNNINVGTATMIINGIEYYKGSVEKTFQITAKKFDVQVEGLENKIYTGTEITQNITVKDGTKLLTESDDYTIAYQNNINVGTATMTITGKGNYSGTITKEFEILAVEFDVNVVGIKDKVYTGEEVTQVIAVTHDGKWLQEDKDYTVSYLNNINAGTASIIIRGIGTYSGSVTMKFKITPKEIWDVTVSKIEDKTYTGEEITQDILVKDGDKTLVKDRDYTIAYQNNINVGTATMTITGKGNYSGTITKEFEILAVEFDVNVVGIKDKVYTGEEVTQVIAVTHDGKWLQEDKDYTVSYLNNINAGTASIIIRGISTYSGSVTMKFKITPKEIWDVTVSNIEDKIYTGSIQTQKPIVKDGNKILKEGIDYNIDYFNNIEVGTATMHIVGIGNYCRVYEETFQILSKTYPIEMSGVKSKVYTGTEIVQDIEVKGGNRTLVEGTDYTVTYKDNVNVGVATIIVKGIGKYTGTITETFEILAKTLDVKVSGIDDKIYTGTEIVQDIVLKDGNKPLAKDTDYTISYKNNINVGTATVIITGIGNYTGRVEETFKIIAKKQDIIVNELEDKVYTGVAQTQKITVKDGDKILVEGIDYTILYTDNINPGIATVTIQMKGDYSGEKRMTFYILPGDVCGFHVTKSNTSSISLSWDEVDGATGYTIYYKKNSGEWIEICNTTQVTYTDMGLKAATKKSYAVRAYKMVDGKNLYGNSATIHAMTIPEKIKGFSVSGVTANSISLKWNKMSGASGYFVYRKDSTGKSVLIADTTSLSFTNKKLSSGKIYEYVVKAYTSFNGKRYEGASSTLKASTAPSKVTGLKASATKNSVKLSWKKVNGATGYIIYRMNRAKKWVKIASTKKLTYTNKSLNKGKKYTYAVKAYKSYGGKIYYADYPKIIVSTKRK